MLQSRLPSFLVLPSRRWSRSSRRRRRAQQPLKPSSQEGPGLSLNKAGVLARPGLRIGDGHRRLVSRLMPLPHLRVGLEGGTGRGEVGETWGRWSRRSVLNNALVQTGVKINTYSPPFGGGGPYHRLPLSNSPATTISATWPRLGGNLDCSQTGPMMTLVRFYVHQNCLTDGPDPRSPLRFLWNLLGLQVILVCKSLGNPIGPYQDLFMRLVGRASIAPLALEGHLWA